MIREYTIQNQETWDAVVRSISDYDVFYLSDYSRAFMEETPKNGVPILLYYENKQDRAINVVLKRDVAEDNRLKGKIEKGKYYDLTTPYGYGSFMGNVSDWNALNREYNEYCISNHYICEFIRFELFSEYYKHYDGDVETKTHNVVRGLNLSTDELWMDFKQKVRKNVKRANSYNLKIIIENTGTYLNDFLRIYYSTMDRSDAEDEYYFSKQFYEDMNKMQNNICYFHVVYQNEETGENKIISTELVIYGSENAYSYLGGTDREYFDLRPNDFLKWEIIKWAKNKGLKNFVLGGGYGADDGIFQYKICLAPHGIRDFYIGRKVFDKDAYAYLVGLRNFDDINPNYFPIYRS